VYIAQPPLYKLKHGKSERYLKDDHELARYMLELALHDAQVYKDQAAWDEQRPGRRRGAGRAGAAVT